MHLRKALQIFENNNSLIGAEPPTLASTGRNANASLSQMGSPFDSSMALTVLVLLTALFFMGFFSIFIRRAHRDPVRHQPPNHRLRASKGVDPAVISSLPVCNYYGSEANKCYYNTEDCAICLGGFEEYDVVKVIPRCRHVFHVECIDTWLVTRASCPVCRGTQLFGGDLVRTEHRVTVGERQRETCIDHASEVVELEQCCSSSRQQQHDMR